MSPPSRQQPDSTTAPEMIVDHECRQHCRDRERLPEMSERLITWAAITMSWRLTRCKARPAERLDIAHGYVMPEV